MQEKQTFDPQDLKTKEQDFIPKQEFNFSEQELNSAKESKESAYQEEVTTPLLSYQTDKSFNLTPGFFFKAVLTIFSLFIFALGLNTLYQLGSIVYLLFNLTDFSFTSLISHLTSLTVQSGLLLLFGGIIYLLRREYKSIKALQEHAEKQKQAEIVLSSYAQVEEATNGSASLTHHHGKVFFSNAQEAIDWCQAQIQLMQINPNHPAISHWQNAVNNYMSPGQVLQLFSFYVLEPFDQEVIKLIHKRASTDALVIAFSHFVLLDLFFITWRNLNLMTEITKIYGIKLGYYARFKMFKHLLLNLFVAGITESLDQYLDLSSFISSNLLAKLSTKTAQGISLGFLSARFGIKCLEFSRPLPFSKKHRPSLTGLSKSIAQQVVNTIKSKNEPNT
ncbi:hypothetical protein CKF54_02725 [Psittacicella hinzii]|uniref:TIGR01620 family protein n=1 Tax=Psittacicella hinzii TaxID=2028575 RepID=A0A3A1Y8I6_9GAMM|nr:TIGR01620 family protein [Psittacicella hinzii]RIY33540.1 hypothetical protein CKF54_02725 [Psittacicella hinzii]